MKKLVTMIAVALTLTQFAVANEIYTDNKTFVLNEFNFDPQSNLANLNIEYGVAEVDLVKRILTITLHITPSCPEGMMCAAVMPVPEVIELPITQVSIGFCGGILLIASRDMTPLDGLYKGVELFYQGENICTKQFDPRVKITYTVNGFYRKLGVIEHHVSTMSGYVTTNVVPL